MRQAVRKKDGGRGITCMQMILLLTWGVFLQLAPLPDAVAAVAGKITIEGLSSAGPGEFLDIFGLREGQTFGAEEVRTGIKRAFLKGIFEDISVKVADGDPADVTITVREKDFIRKIIVQGDFQVPAKTIRRHLIFSEDQIMRYDLLGQAEEGLSRELADYGYPWTKISFRTEKTRTPYRVDLVVTVDTGVSQKIRKVIIPGADEDIAGQLSISPGDIFDHSGIRKKLQKLKGYLKTQGYLNPSAGPYSFENGELTIPVDPGRKVVVSFEGNSALSEKRLRKAITFLEIGSLNDEAVAESVDRMLDAYHSDGYPNAQVAPVLVTDERSIEITYFIFEGERVKVGSVVFSGSSLPAKSLKEVISLKEKGYYNPDQLERDREALKEFYSALGFLEMEVRPAEVSIDDGNLLAAIRFTIEEGQRTEIAEIDIAGADPVIRDRLSSVIGIKAGDPYNEVDISDARFRILDHYSTLGYTNIDVEVDRTVENYRAKVRFEVIEGPKKIMGKSIVTGNMKTKYGVIRRELDVREGEPFNFHTLAGIRQRLYKLGLFTDVDIEVISLEKERNDLLIRLKEGSPGTFEFGFGFAEYEKLRGFAEVRYRNLWGMHRQGLVRTELSSLEQRYILQYQEPWFLGRRLPFRAFFLYENRKEINTSSKETRFKLKRYTVSAGVEKKFSDSVKGELFYELSYVNTSDVLPDVILTKEDTGSLAISGIRPGLIYDTRDSPIEPRKGILASISLKLASPLLLSETHFAKLVMYGSTFHALTRRMTLALSLRGGVAYGFGGTDELPLVERFFLGGRSTVRGYEQDTLGPKGADNNPTGGNAFLMGNLELRTALGKGFGVVPFLDAGNVWVKPADFRVSDIRYTAGIGLRYETPVGPLRIDYGLKLNKEARESRGSVHFSIGHAF